MHRKPVGVACEVGLRTSVAVAKRVQSSTSHGQPPLLRPSPVLLQAAMPGGQPPRGASSSLPRSAEAPVMGAADFMGGGGPPKESPFGVSVPRPKGLSGDPIQMSNVLNIEAKRRRMLGDELSSRFVVEKIPSTEAPRGRAIGIDLGTTNSCVSFIDPETKRPKIIPSPTGSWVFPTAVTFDKGHQVRMFGEEARACARTSASSTLCSGKRLIGRRFGELGNVHSQMSKTNMLTVTERGEVAVEIMGRTYSVVHITAMFLRYLKSEAEKFLKEPVTAAVVSVPAYFTPQQKIATEDAALAAGFDVWEIIDEPSAACLTYTVLGGVYAPKAVGAVAAPATTSATKGTDDGVRTPSKAAPPSASAAPAAPPSSTKRVLTSLVFDLGGGTLDCALMDHDTKTENFTLVATHGDPMLGGNDWDIVLSDFFARRFEKKWSVPLEDPEGNLAQSVGDNRSLLLEAERCKIHFTHSNESYKGYQRGFHFSKKLRDVIPLEANMTLEEYLELTRPLRERCVTCLNKLFAHAQRRPQDIDHILLVGAMTRDPPIRRLLEEYFGKAVSGEEKCPADYAVAMGAAIRSGMLEGHYPLLSANTRFVQGTVQRQRTGSAAQRLWHLAKESIPSWLGGTRNQNPNAIGHRWRGVVQGLSDEEIMNYAKELVEFEAAQERRFLLERAEDHANAVMSRVAKDSSRRQGMQEKRIKQLADQLKFWQYMVHNFHDHEEQLAATTKTLEKYLDELEGICEDAGPSTAEDPSVAGAAAGPPGGAPPTGTPGGRGPMATASVTATGTLDFSHLFPNGAPQPPKASSSTAAQAGGATKTAATGTGPASGSSTEGKNTSSSSVGAAATSRAGPKILRRSVPLPAGAADAAALVDGGHAAFANTPVTVPENTRSTLFRQTVDERAWREPPTPPGESGSWAEVKKALDEGADVGVPIPLSELTRPMTIDEMLATLCAVRPLDPFPSPQHEAAFEASCRLADMAAAPSPGLADYEARRQGQSSTQEAAL